jgi:hypothetical protein
MNDEMYVTLRVRLPRSTVAEMDIEIAADPRHTPNRNRFVYCAVKYALYCLQFDGGLEWIVEEQDELRDGSG